jgi:hypothetical protein
MTTQQEVSSWTIFSDGGTGKLPELIAFLNEAGATCQKRKDCVFVDTTFLHETEKGAEFRLLADKMLHNGEKVYGTYEK